MEWHDDSLCGQVVCVVMVFNYPKNARIRRLVRFVGVFSCVVVCVALGSKLLDIYRNVLGPKHLQWNGLNIAAPSGHVLVVNSTRGLVSVARAGAPTAKSGQPVMGFQEIRAGSKSPYKEIEDRCNRLRCESTTVAVETDSLSCVSAEKQAPSRGDPGHLDSAHQVALPIYASCRILGTKVETYFKGDRRSLEMFMEVIKASRR